MGFHTFDPEGADRLEDESRFRWCSAEELRQLVSPDSEAVVADLGSGTGFYTDVVAPAAGTVYAVDVQPAMHALYREKGVPKNVHLVTAAVGDLPVAGDSLDVAYSTMTYHEFASGSALADIARVLRPGGRLVTVDWSYHGSGVEGPPLDERFGLGEAVSAMAAAGFTVETAIERSETFLAVARQS